MLAGDYNVVPTDLDIYPTKSWDRDALLQPESRAAYQRLLSQGWTDAIRALHPKEPMYTFWDYMRNRWERDGGLRLDHILLSSALTERLQDAGVDRHDARNRGRERSCARMGEASRCAERAVTLSRRQARGDRPRGRRLRRKLRNRPVGPAVGLARRSPTASAREPALSRRPLLVIDGDSFAHRSYHALPKTIRRSDGKGAGAILGFANFLLRLYADEQPRAVIVGWDSLDAPTKRHEMFPAYQSGRRVRRRTDRAAERPARICRRLRVCKRQSPWVRGGRFSRRRGLPPRSAQAAPPWWRAAIGILFSSPRQAQRSSTHRGAAKLRASGLKRSGSDMASIRSKCRTSSRSAAIHPTNCLARRGSGRNALLNWCGGTGRLMRS